MEWRWTKDQLFEDASKLTTNMTMSLKSDIIESKFYSSLNNLMVLLQNVYSNKHQEYISISQLHSICPSPCHISWNI